jgi:DNA-binding transcriptional LysR family regulator
MVGFDSDLVIRHELDRALAGHDAEPEVVMEFDNIETIKRAVEIDAGVALLPEPTIGRELAAGTLCVVRIAGAELVRPLGIVHARGKPPAPTVARFIELLHGHARDVEADVDRPLAATP